MEAEGDEGEYNSGDPRRAVRAGERARQTERAVAAEGEAEKRRDAADCERTKSRGEQGEEQQRDSVVVLAEGERVLVRVEDVRVEEMERIERSGGSPTRESRRSYRGRRGQLQRRADAKPTATSSRQLEG